MNIDEFKMSVQKFADRPEDVVVGKDNVIVEIHGQIIEAKLRFNSGLLYCHDGEIEEPAEVWIPRRLGQLDVLANRILEVVPNDTKFVPVEASILATIDQDPTQSSTSVDDAVNAIPEMIDHLPAASTDVIYLTSDAGEGKTSIIEALARKQAKDYLSGQSDWILLPVALGGRPFLRLDEVVVGTLSNRLRFRFLYYEGVLELVKRGSIVLGLDGFEEMFIESQSGEVVSSLGNLVSKLGSQGVLLFAARKAYYHYSNFNSQARLFDAIRDYNVTFAEIQIHRWGERQFKSCCIKSGIGNDRSDAIYKELVGRLGADHPVLTRAVLARRAIDEFSKDEGSLEFANKLGSSDMSPEETFESFVEALIDREATQKWIDRAGEVAKPLLPADHHHFLLMAIAEEMWISGTEILPGNILDTTAELCVDELGYLSDIVRQVKERIRQHALLRRRPEGEVYSFDHDEFRAFYIGKQLSNLAINGDERNLRRFITPKPLPDLSFRVGVKDISNQVSSREDILTIFMGLAANGPRGSYVRSNAASLMLRCLSVVGGDEITLEGLHFTTGSTNKLKLHGMRFNDCVFEKLEIRNGSLDHTYFIDCQVVDLILTENIEIEDVHFTESSIPDVLHIGVNSETDAIYAPGDIKKVLEKMGVIFDSNSNGQSEGDSDVSTETIDDRIRDIDKIFRAFRRSTQVNDSVMRLRLSQRWRMFESNVLPDLLSNNILIEVPHTGAGHHRRFKLGVSFDDFEYSAEKSRGDFDKFMLLLCERT